MKIKLIIVVDVNELCVGCNYENSVAFIEILKLWIICWLSIKFIMKFLFEKLSVKFRKL